MSEGLTMASTNTKTKLPTPKTHGGAVAVRTNAEFELRRSVMSTMLFEDQFYEDGVSISDRIADLVPKVKPELVKDIAIEARHQMKLRHVPLWIIRIMAKLPTHKHLVADTLDACIKRADEPAEFLALYWKNGKEPLSHQVKKGLARSIQKFDEYSMAKYLKDKDITLRDVMFLSHSKPKDARKRLYTRNERKLEKAGNKKFVLSKSEKLYKKLADLNLSVPDTWEVALSSSKDKTAEWTRLLKDKRMGGMAVLRNLRNCINAKVSKDLISKSIMEANYRWVLPFRFISAAKYAPQFEEVLDKAMITTLENGSKLPGKTVVVVDVSGSMYGSSISGKSEMDRAKSACALASILREVCEEPVIYATAGSDFTRAHKTQLVPARRGMDLIDAIYNMCRPLGGGGIFLNQVMNYIDEIESRIDRVVVITDEQDCSTHPNDSPSKAKLLGKKNYMINVASYKLGIGYKKWHHIDGFSEEIINYIKGYEELCENLQ